MLSLKGFLFLIVATQILGLLLVYWSVDCSSSRNDASSHLLEYSAETKRSLSIIASQQCPHACGGHGRCVSRDGATPVCVCNAGRVGKDCNDTLQNWYKAAGLDDFIRRDGHLWRYLNSSAYRTRYASVGYLLRTRRHILEVGGFLSPVDGFLPEGSAAESVTVVDPTIDGSSSRAMGSRQILHLPMTLGDYEPRGDEDALLFLGLHPEKTFEDSDFLRFFVKSSLRTLILEGADTKKVRARVDQLVTLAGKHRFKVTLRMTFDFSEMGRELGIDMVLAPANTRRRLCVLERL